MLFFLYYPNLGRLVLEIALLERSILARSV